MMMLQGGVYPLSPARRCRTSTSCARFTEIGTGYIGPIPIPVIIAALVFAVAYVVLRFTTLGRYHLCGRRQREGGAALGRAVRSG